MLLSVQFDHCGRRFELRPAWPVSAAAPPQDGFERVASATVPSGPWAAVPRWLAACDAWRLRALAEAIDDGHGLQQQCNAQVHAAVVRLLQQGRLRAFELVRRPLRDDQKAEAPRATSQAFTPSMLRGAATPEPAPALAPAEAPPQPIDQDLQAAVLRRAAEHGVPFCEECERRRPARQDQAAELEPA